MSDEWQEVAGRLVLWDEPKELVGTYLGFSEEDGKFGKQERHRIRTDDGSIAAFFAPSALARLLEHATQGQRMKIVYPGTTATTKSGQQFKEFRLYVSRVETDEVPF